MKAAFWAWLALVGAGAFWLFVQENDFPYFRHPDEPDKVDQIIAGEWNLHHPPFLLLATRALMARGAGAAGQPWDPQAVVETGRALVAACCALAVVCLAALVWRWYGAAAGVLAGLLLATHHQLFELAHYLKEDPVLLAGVAAVFFAGDIFWRHRTVPAAALLGAACGLALAGKYLGLLLLPVGVALVWRGTLKDSRRWRLAAVFALGFAVAAAILNLPALANCGQLGASVDREMAFAFAGRGGMTRRVPHALYWNVFVANSTPALWVGLAVYFGGWLSPPRLRRPVTADRHGAPAPGAGPDPAGPRPLPEVLAATFPAWFALLLSCSPKTHDRYFLPATALLTAFAAVGLVTLGRAVGRRYGRLAGVAVPAAAVLCQFGSLPTPVDWKTLTTYWRAFRTDDLAELRAWIDSNLPAAAVIAQDRRAGLPVTGSDRHERRQGSLAQRVLDGKYAADHGSLAELQRAGVTHVAVSQSDFGRYYVTGMTPQAGADADYRRRRDFYDALFREGKLQWERPRGEVVYLHPGLRLYRIAGDATAR